MKRSAAPSVMARRLQEKKNGGKAGESEPGRSKFKAPVASVGHGEPSTTVGRRIQGKENGGIAGESEPGRKKFTAPPVASLRSGEPCASKSLPVEATGRRSEDAGKDAAGAGRSSLQVLDLINSGRDEAEGGSGGDSSDRASVQCGSLLSPRLPGLVPVGDDECRGEDLKLPSVANLKAQPGRSWLPGSSTVGVKRRCRDDFENGNHGLRKRRQGEEEVICIGEEGVARVGEEEVVCLGEVPAILTGTIADGDRLSVDGVDVDVKVEVAGSGGDKKQSLHVEEEHGSNAVCLDPKVSKAGNTWQSPQSQREQSLCVEEEHDSNAAPLNPKVLKAKNTGQGPQSHRASLHHKVNLKEASKPAQEAGSTEYYSVMYCPRKKNAKRKGPWSDGIIVCQGRSCTLQDMDGKNVTKANVQGLKDMPEGATLEVGKFEIEVMRKASSEEVLSGTLYLVDKAPQATRSQLPALSMKRQMFKSVKPDGLQQSRTL